MLSTKPSPELEWSNLHWFGPVILFQLQRDQIYNMYMTSSVNNIFNIYIYVLYIICNIGSWGQSKSFKLQGLRAFGPSSNSTSTLSFLAPRTCEGREPKRFRECTYRTQTKILGWFNLFLFQHISTTCALGQSARNFERASAITSSYMQYYAVSYHPCFKFRCKKSQFEHVSNSLLWSNDASWLLPQYRDYIIGYAVTP